MNLRETRRLALAGLALGILAVTLACGDDDDDGATATSPTSAGGLPSNLTTVTVSDNSFSPANLQVPVGTNITWAWSGSNPHSVTGTFDGQEVNSPTLTGTGTFLQAFQKAGVFEYQCGVHGAAMAGKVTMQ